MSGDLLEAALRPANLFRHTPNGVLRNLMVAFMMYLPMALANGNYGLTSINRKFIMRALMVDEVSFVSGGDGGATPPPTPPDSGTETTYFEDGSSQTKENGVVVAIFDCDGNSVAVNPTPGPTLSEGLAGGALIVGIAAATSVAGAFIILFGGTAALVRGRGK